MVYGALIGLQYGHGTEVPGGVPVVVSCTGSSRVEGDFTVMSTVTADARYLRRVLAFLIVATLASGAVMAYAAASLG